MADFPINVVINPSGAQRGRSQVNRELQSIESQANRLRDTLTRAFTFVGIGLGIQQLSQLADAFTVLQNRLRSVTADQQELAAATQEVFDIALKVRAPVKELATLYARISVASSEIGASQSEVAEFVELTGKALATQGSSGQEAAGALLQLSQAIGGTVIQAQEFNSLIDGARPLLEAVANGSDRFGGSVNALRTAVRDGTVTSKEFFEAALAGSEIIRERFGRSLVTIGQAFTNLRTETLRFVSESETLQTVINSTAQAILFLADNIDTVARIGGTVAVVLSLATAFTVVTTAVRALTAAIAVNPLGALLIGLTTAITALTFFADTITIAEGSLTTIEDVGVAAFQLIGEAIDEVVLFFENNFGFIADFAKDIFDEINISVEGFAKFVALAIDTVIGAFRASFNVIVGIYTELANTLGGLFVVAFNEVIDTVESSLNVIISGFNSVAGLINESLTLDSATFGRLEKDYEDSGKTLGETLMAGIDEGFQFTGAQTALNNLLTRADQVTQERIARERKAQNDLLAGQEKLNRIREAPSRVDPEFKKFIEDLREETRILGLNNREREIENGLLRAKDDLNRDLTTQEMRLLDTELRANQAAKDRAEILDSIRQPQEDLIRTQQALNTLLAQGEINAQEYGTALRNAQLGALESSTDFASGFERGFLRLQQSVGDFSTISETAITGAFNGATDAIINFVTTGEANFKQLTAQILADIARIALQQALFGALSAAFGGPAGAIGGAVGGAAAGSAGGAAAGSAAATPGFQTGGEFTVGGSGGLDSQMVQFRATPGERVTVETSQQQRDASRERQGSSQGQGGATNIVNVLDPSLIENFLTSPNGQKVLINTIGRNSTSVNQVVNDAF